VSRQDFEAIDLVARMFPDAWGKATIIDNEQFARDLAGELGCQGGSVRWMPPPVWTVVVGFASGLALCAGIVAWIAFGSPITGWRADTAGSAILRLILRMRRPRRDHPFGGRAS
jgi:hypothetical protein